MPDDSQVLVIDAPHFLATKLEAFFSRGQGDIYSSHDFEDILAVVNGRNKLIEEISASPEAVRVFIGDSFRLLLQRIDMLDAIEGHLASIEGSELRARLVLDRLNLMA